ncbi:hypothetical protein BDQ17DRAFT_1334630 [Cyathus striatus]|nr:hypothetical protein BDQ17DRAFT_1334630 [Cyathus striatus]
MLLPLYTFPPCMLSLPVCCPSLYAVPPCTLSLPVRCPLLPPLQYKVVEVVMVQYKVVVVVWCEVVVVLVIVQCEVVVWWWCVACLKSIRVQGGGGVVQDSGGGGDTVQGGGVVVVHYVPRHFIAHRGGWGCDDRRGGARTHRPHHLTDELRWHYSDRHPPVTCQMKGDMRKRRGWDPGRLTLMPSIMRREGKRKGNSVERVAAQRDETACRASDNERRGWAHDNIGHWLGEGEGLESEGVEEVRRRESRGREET